MRRLSQRRPGQGIGGASTKVSGRTGMSSGVLTRSSGRSMRGAGR